jgi:type I restriction enzyme S subunit
MRYKLGEICEIVSGSTPKTTVPEYWDGDLRWVTPAELSDDSYMIYDTVRHITKVGAEKSGLSSFPEGTVLLSSRAPIGKVALAGCEMYCNQGFKNLICSDKINNTFLYWFLKSKREYLNSLGRGATFKEISKQIVSNIEIDVPSIEDQNIAANTLNHLMDIIGLRKKELQELDELIKARFVELFGHQSHNEKGLPYKTIDDVAEIYLGITHTPEYVDEGVTFISAKNTSGDYLDLSDVKYISREEFEGAPQGSKPHVNDVLFSRVGSNLGHPVILEEELELCTFVSLGFLRSKGFVTSNYLKHWMRDEVFPKQVSEHVKGGGQPNLNTGWLKQFKIIVPEMNMQLEFDDFCKQVDKSKSAVQKALEETQLLYESLMQKYFG